jgi:hypothetical protein
MGGKICYISAIRLRDDGMAWPLYCNTETTADPPAEYLTGQWDEQLRNGFMDASIKRMAEERLRQFIHRLEGLWAQCCGEVGAYERYGIAHDKRIKEEARHYDENGQLLPGKSPHDMAKLVMACWTLIYGCLGDVKAVLVDHKEREKVTRADVLREAEHAMSKAKSFSPLTAWDEWPN